MSETNFLPNWKQHPQPGGMLKRRPFVVTLSEIQSFNRCRWAWNETSANRKSLVRVGMPTAALNIGSAVHWTLSQHWAGNNWLQALNDFHAATVTDVSRHYEKVVGTRLGDVELRALSDQRWIAQKILEAYFARFGHEWPTKPYKIVACEVTFAVPLVPDEDIWLMGTIDRIYTDQYGSVIPGEIKTYKQAPRRELWRSNYQSYAYANALRELLGVIPPMFLYDGLRKKEPTTPKILVKSGNVSKKWIDTTYDEYIRVVRQAHRGRVPEDYRDILTRLLARDQSPMNAFTTRFRVPISEAAMKTYWEELQLIAREMKFNPIITRSKDFMGCPMCRHRGLCDADLFGEDYDYIVANEYRKGVTPTRRASRIATPKKIQSLDDLVEFARDQPPDPLRRKAILGPADPD